MKVMYVNSYGAMLTTLSDIAKKPGTVLFETVVIYVCSKLF